MGVGLGCKVRLLGKNFPAHCADFSSFSSVAFDSRTPRTQATQVGALGPLSTGLFQQAAFSILSAGNHV